MTPPQLLELSSQLEILLNELQTDVDLSSTRDQHIRAAQRISRLSAIIELVKLEEM